MTSLKSWLDLVNEEAIDPNLPIIDAHHHCWGSVPPQAQLPTYGFEELVCDIATSGHNIIATVYLQAYSYYRNDGPEHLRPVGETEHINALAELGLKVGGKAKNICAGITGWADFFKGRAVGEELDAHIAAAPKRLKGMRYLVTYDVDNPHLSGGNSSGMLGRKIFREGLAELAPRGLLFEAMIFHPQIPEVTDLARSYEDLTIILNHIGAPMLLGRFANRGAEVFKEWTKTMEDLAGCPNVVVKLGGLNSARTGMSFLNRETPPTSKELAEKQGEYIRRTIDIFGPDRCMFESNFPVDKAGCSYTVLWNSFKRMTSDYSAQERSALFNGTAQRIYGLEFA